jgi:hypothetical protein
MGTLPVRIAVAAVLLATAAFAAILVRRADARVPFEQVLALGRQLDPLSERLAMLETSHAQYAVGNHPLSATDRFATQLRETVAATAVIGPMLQSPEAGRELGAFADATARLAHVDGRAREYLLAGDTARAAREVTGEGQDLLLSMRTALSALRREETAAIAAAHDAAAARARTALLVTAGVWVLGLLALVPMARRRDDADPHPPDRRTPEPVDGVDIGAVADLSSDIARAETSDALAQHLARAAVMLDATGIIVWVGAGEELFPVVAHGYEQAVVRRLGAIPLRGENATAAAWRQQRLQVVHGDDGARSALAAPICGPSGCLAVLAVELPRGREDDPSTRAVVTLLAAQLSSLVAGWPSPSITR